MIYKIIGNFTDQNFNRIIDKISLKFNFIYCNDTLYISIKNIDSLSENKDYLAKLFKPAKDFFITEITEQNILKENEMISEWCRENFVRLESQKFEIEQQAKLKKVWLAMDNMEIQLKDELLKKNQQN